MTAFGTGSEVEGDAIQTDRYLELLLAAHASRPSPVALEAAGAFASPTEPGMASAARLVERTLPRIHPSFLFEEALADRLRSAAEALWPRGERDAQVVASIAFPVAPPGGSIADRHSPRRLLPIGALASGVSIAGAAVYAWRRRQRIA